MSQKSQLHISGDYNDGPQKSIGTEVSPLGRLYLNHQQKSGIIINPQEVKQRDQPFVGIYIFNDVLDTAAV